MRRTTKATRTLKRTPPPAPNRAHLLLFEGELWRDLRVAAAQEGTTVSAILRRLAKAYLYGETS